MYIQEKVNWDDEVDRNLAHLRTLGVDYIAINQKGLTDALSTSEKAIDFFKKAKVTVLAHGMQLRTIISTGLTEVMKGTPARDQEIDSLLTVLEAMGTAEIPILAYNFKFLTSNLMRSQPTNGRGAATYISFDYEEYLKKPAPAVDPPIPEQKMWDNLAYFLKAVIPAAEKANVRMALHPDDPPVPSGTPALAGAAHIVSTFDQYRRIFDLAPSPSNGMLFCQGCVKEMQGVNVYDAIRQIGSLNKIVAVHFRNVRGSFPKFQETFVDDGDVDMYRAMRAYRDVGFKGPFAVDHSPAFPDSHIANQAFVIGYMRGLIHAVYREQ